MSRHEQEPTVIQVIATYFGATSAPARAATDASRGGDDEAVQADVNTYFGVEAAR